MLCIYINFYIYVHSDSLRVLGPFENEYLLHNLHLKCKCTISDLSEIRWYTFFIAEHFVSEAPYFVERFSGSVL